MAVTLEGLVFVFGVLVGDGLASADGFEGGEDVFFFDAVELEQPLGLVIDVGECE